MMDYTWTSVDEIKFKLELVLSERHLGEVRRDEIPCSAIARS
ncbi:hypothetical protein [Sphingomonas citri]|nr:hypothetical protein [Sphingomonas citri]